MSFGILVCYLKITDGFYLLDFSVHIDTLYCTIECLKSDSHLPKKLFCFLQCKPLKNNEKCFLFHLRFRSQDI